MKTFAEKRFNKNSLFGMLFSEKAIPFMAQMNEFNSTFLLAI